MSNLKNFSVRGKVSWKEKSTTFNQFVPLLTFFLLTLFHVTSKLLLLLLLNNVWILLFIYILYCSLSLSPLFLRTQQWWGQSHAVCEIQTNSRNQKVKHIIQMFSKWCEYLGKCYWLKITKTGLERTFVFRFCYFSRSFQKFRKTFKTKGTPPVEWRVQNSKWYNIHGRSPFQSLRGIVNFSVMDLLTLQRLCSGGGEVNF